MSMEDLAKRVQILEDIEAIKQLKFVYGEICDDKYNPDRMDKLFTEDALWDGGEKFGVHKGKAAIKKFFTEVSKGLAFAVHYFLQPIIKVDGDRATGSWYLWQAATLGDGKAIWLAGREDEVYQKVNGQWLFKEIKLKIFFATPFEEGWHKNPMVF